MPPVVGCRKLRHVVQRVLVARDRGGGGLMRSTHTYAVLEISRAAFDEIKAHLEAAGYGQAFHDDGTIIDMHGIAVKVAEESDGNA